MTRPKRSFGFKRWILLGLMILGGWLALGVKGIFTPISPAVILPAEPFLPGIKLFVGTAFETYFTNSMASLAIAVSLLLILVFFVIQPALRGKQEVPAGFYNFFEMVLEYFWITTQNAAGKHARRIFPFVMTIFLFVLTANMVKLLPFHETVGYLEPAHDNLTGFSTAKLFSIGALPVITLDGSKPVKASERVAAEGGEEEHHLCEQDCFVVPFFRGVATDLNFTVSLALITMVMVQVFGFSALGFGYITKFFNFRTIIDKPFFGLMDTIVGVLELISEFAKVLSFGLRLFGTIFAGTLLLGILGILVPVLIPGFLYGLETFVGLIQAYVFSALAMTFMSQATVSHHGGEHTEH